MANKKTSSNSTEIKSLIKQIKAYTAKSTKSTKTQDKKERVFNASVKQTESMLLAFSLKERMNKALYKRLITPKKRPQIKIIEANIHLLKTISESEDKKKYNIKSFNQAKKDLEADNNVNYNVYVKLRTFTDKNDENTAMDIHQTVHVQGKANIKNKIKELIDFNLSYPYIEKVDVVNVAVNRVILEEEEYRWLGGESQANRIKYFKAWDGQMAFKYHSYNLDMNDDLPYECAPNALFKLYGNRENKGFIARIADGGLNYVKKELEPVRDEDEDSDDEEIDGKRGYTPMDILRFCDKHKIRCYGYDWKLQQFITNKNSGIKFNHDNIPAFVFYMNDQHIYLINDKEIRQSLLKANGNTDFVSLLAKERSIQLKERNEAVDLPFEEWDKVTDTTIYITEHRRVHNTFYKLVCSGEVFGNKLKLSETDGIVRFEYKNKNVIVYNPDYNDVKKTLERLNKEKYQFNNQRLNSLAMEVLEKEFGGFSSSTFNKDGDEIFHSDFIRNCQFNGWFSKPKSDKLHAYDYNKHYTSCLMGQNVQYGFPIYTVFDEVKEFSGELATGFFFVKTSNFFPFRGNGWYDADLVSYGLSKDIITKNDITHQYLSSHQLNPDHFTKFIEAVYNTFENPKSAINKLIGCFGHDYKNKNVHHFTTDGRNVFMELNQNKDAKVKYVYHDEFTSANEPINIEEVDIRNYLRNKKPLCYHVYNDKRQKMFHNSLPFFYKIYNVSAMKMHQMATQIGGKVSGIFTDTIIFEGKVNKPNCDKTIIGGIRESNLKEFTKLTNTEARSGEYELMKPQLKNITEFKLSDNKSVFITGLAGTGKSTKCNALKSELEQEQYIVTTPTHKSALIVNGTTIYNAFNINPQDHTYVKASVEKLVKKGVKWVFIDEISMIPSKVWAILRDIKRIYKFNFVMSGDMGQLNPVETKCYDVLNSSVFHELCDGQILELTKNWRAESCPEFASFISDLMKVRNGEKINYKDYGRKECRKSLAWTNKTRKAVNAEWMLKESKGKTCYLLNNCKVFVGLPVIANETRTFNKTTEIFNNEEFDVTTIDKDSVTLTNSRITVSIKHSEFKFFDLAYCITVHKSQGSTYDFEYSIYDYNRFDSKLLYTAMSRSTKKANVNFVYRHYETQSGNIYKIINEDTNKIYIGSTKRADINDRFEEHKKCMDNSPLHSDMQNGGNWKIELVQKVEYVDEQELLIAETCQIMAHDSIAHGYNTKYSVSYENIY